MFAKADEYYERGDRKGENSALLISIAAYRVALEERTQDRVPLDWAATQTNLGAALQTLGSRESGTARLEEAVAAYRDALQEQSRARVPLEWAMTQVNLGNALFRLGERESGTARLEEGVGVLKLDGEDVARQTMERTLPIILQWDENFDVGADPGTPVDDKDYRVPFKFTGKLNKLTLTIDRPMLSPEKKC